MKETWIMQRILGILPTTLYHFRTAWDNISGADKSITNLFERLRLEEDRLNDGQSSSKPAPQNAFVSKQTNKLGKSASSQKQNSMECFKCGKTGYIK